MAGPAAAQIDEAKRFAEIVAILQKHHLVQGLTPEKVRDIFVDLGPTFVKFGQILSMRSDILCRARDAAHGRDAHAADRGGEHSHAGLRPPVAGGLFGHRHPAARLGLHRAGARRDAHGRPARGREGTAPGPVRDHEPRRASAQARRRTAQIHAARERAGFSRRARRDLAHRTGGA